MRQVLIAFFASIIFVLPALAVGYPTPQEAKEGLKTLMPQYDATPKDTKLLMEIGLCYHSIGGVGEADAVVKSIDFFQKALDLEPNNNEAKAWLGSAMTIKARDVWMMEAMNYVNKGVSLMDAAVASEPDNIAIRITRGTNYLYMPSFLGKDGVMLTDLEFVAAKIHGGDDKKLLQDVYYKLGLAYKKVNNTNKAKENFNLAVKLAPDADIAHKIAKEEHL